MIVKVTYGIVGEGIVKHVSKFDSRNYCVIEYLTGDYKKKTIELGATPHSMRSLSEELDIIIEYNKKQEIKTIVESWMFDLKFPHVKIDLIYMFESYNCNLKWLNT